jgi:hypothetical protein
MFLPKGRWSEVLLLGKKPTELVICLASFWAKLCFERFFGMIQLFSLALLFATGYFLERHFVRQIFDKSKFGLQPYVWSFCNSEVLSSLKTY